ncbi:MAG: DUF3239 domain-containing protein [Corynebacterium sp.]|nr:DUF3239 domain-containing protein [Corynebacterium sp.]
MNIFPFEVDNEHAKQNNELLKDTKRLQISALLFAVILLGIGFLLKTYLGGAMGIIVLSTFGIMALVSLGLIVVIPRQVGDAASLYARYELCPAIIAKLNSRDMVLLALVNINSDPNDTPKWGLAARTVTRIEGHARHKGEKVPSVAVTGRRSVRTQDRWGEISPMPIAWGTTDPTVINAAQQAIPQNSWDLLRNNVGKLDDVLSTPYNLLEL